MGYNLNVQWSPTTYVCLVFGMCYSRLTNDWGKASNFAHSSPNKCNKTNDLT